MLDINCNFKASEKQQEESMYTALEILNSALVVSDAAEKRVALIEHQKILIKDKS